MRKALAILAVLLFAGTAFADRLAQNTTPAERARGCVFSENFLTRAEVEANGGSAIAGTPVFSPITGVTIQAGVDEIIYDINPSLFLADPISVRIDFTPTYNYDSNQIRYIYDTGSTVYHVLKTNDAGNHAMEIRNGNGLNAVIAEGVYGPYWLQNQRNVLVISSTDGASKAWLNGNEIMDDASNWTADTETSLLFGVNFAGSSYGDGTWSKFQVYHSLLTGGEAQDFYDHTTYTWENSATAHYQMRLVDHDATNTTTIDSTGKAGDLTLVAAPTKTAAHGYGLNGTTQYLTGTIAASTFNSAEILIALEFTPDFAVAEDVRRYLLDVDDGAGADRTQIFKFESLGTGAISIYLGGSFIADIPTATYSPYWYQYQRNVLVVAGDATNNLTSAWLNGKAILVGDTSAWTQQAHTRATIGNRYTGAQHFDGKIHSFMVAPLVATELQALDIDHNLRLRGNSP